MNNRNRITIDIDGDLLATVDRLSASLSVSRNRFITESVEGMVQKIEREQTDAAFERMATDSAYQSELLAVEREMGPASDSILDAGTGTQFKAAEPQAPYGRKPRRAAR